MASRRRSAVATWLLIISSGFAILSAPMLLIASTLPWGPDAPSGAGVEAAHSAARIDAALDAALCVLCVVAAGLLAGPHRAIPRALQLGSMLIAVTALAVPVILTGSASGAEAAPALCVVAMLMAPGGAGRSAGHAQGRSQ